MEHKISYEKIREDLRSILPRMVDYAELVDSPVPSSYGVKYVYENEDGYIIEAAIDAIKRLQLENTEKNNFMRKCFGWCTGCKNFKGLGGCGIGKMEQCNKDNDLWQWQGSGLNEDE